MFINLKSVLSTFTSMNNKKTNWGDKAKVDSVVYKVVPEDSTRIAMVETGEAHLAEPVPVTEVQRIEASPDMALSRSDGLGIDYIGFNTEKEPFDDVRVRQAINLAIDTDMIIQGVYNNVGTKATAPMGHGVWGHNPDLEGWGYDVEEAKKLLKEAGYENGFETTIWTNDNKARVDVAGDADYNQYFLFHSDAKGKVGNRSFYSNSRVDELIDLARQETDPQKRHDYYKEAQAIEMEEAPMIFLRNDEDLVVMGKNVKGFWMHPAGILMITDVTVQ
jgi:peptide/nickel transport system substrate-binding protein